MFGVDCLVVYRDGIYEVKINSRGYILINTIGEYRNHGHIKRLETCKKVIGLMKREVVPDSHYLRGTVLRVSTNERYLDKVRKKITKDRHKQKYFNHNIVPR